MSALAAGPVWSLPKDPQAMIGRQGERWITVAALHRARNLNHVLFPSQVPKGDLRDADFRGKSLAGAILAKTDCRRARFDGVDLRRTDLLGTRLDGATFAGAKLLVSQWASSDFTKANLTGVQWYLTPKDRIALRGPLPMVPRLPALEPRARAEGAGKESKEVEPASGGDHAAPASGRQKVAPKVLPLRSAPLGITPDDRPLWNLTGRASLDRVVFLPDAHLSKVDFSRISLVHADLGGTLCDGANFSGCDLSTAVLVGIRCRGARFDGATLRRPDATWIAGQGVDLARASIIDAPPGAGLPEPPEPAAGAPRWHHVYRTLKTFHPRWESGPAVEESRLEALDGWLRDQRRLREGLPAWKLAALHAIPGMAVYLRQTRRPELDPPPATDTAHPLVVAGPPAPAADEAARAEAGPAGTPHPAVAPPLDLPFQDFGPGLARNCRKWASMPALAWGRSHILSPERPYFLVLPANVPGLLGRRVTWDQAGKIHRADPADRTSFPFLPTQPWIHVALETLCQRGDQGQEGVVRLCTLRVRGAFALPTPTRPVALGGLALQVEPDGSLWCALADTGAGSVRTFCLNGLPGGSTWPAGDGATPFQRPTSVAWDELGGFGAGQPQLFVADSGNHTVCQLLPGGKRRTWGQPQRPGLADGEAAQAQFDDPRGLAIYEDGVFVADRGNGRIRLIRASDGQVTTLPLTPGPGEAPQPGGEYRFQDLRAIAWAMLEGEWDLLVLDGHRICRIQGNGTVTTLLGVQDQPGSLDRGPEEDLRVPCLDHPCALATGPSGDQIHILEEGGLLREFDTTRRRLGTVAGLPGGAGGPQPFRPGLLTDGAPPSVPDLCASLGGLRNLAPIPGGGLCLTGPETLACIPVPDRPDTGPTRLEWADAPVRVDEPLEVACTVPDQAWREFRPESGDWTEGTREQRPVTVVIQAFHQDGSPAGAPWQGEGRQGQRFVTRCQFQKPGDGWVQVTWHSDQGVLGGDRRGVRVAPPAGELPGAAPWGRKRRGEDLADGPPADKRPRLDGTPDTPQGP